jgi:hypothetical protein
MLFGAMGLSTVRSSLFRRDHRALRLAAAQVVDIVVTQMWPEKYGDAHLAHLGVPAWLRPRLVFIKAATTVALLASARHPRLRSMTAAALVAYYAAAVTFHVDSHDPWTDVAPAAAFGLVAVTLV